MVDATTPLPAGSKVGEKDSNDRIIGWVRLFDSALTDALGTVAGTPAAGTLLGRLLAIATPLGTPADGAWASGNGTIPSLLKTLAGSLGFPADAAGVSSMIGQLKAHTAALGAPGDAAWTGTGNAGLIALFKLIALKMLDDTAAAITAAQLPSTIGQKAASNSLSIIESSGSTIGTRGYGTTFAITTTAATATAGTGAGATLTLPKGEVCLEAVTAPLYFKIGASGVQADTTTSMHLSVGEKFHIQAATGSFISIIRDGATNATILVSPVA